MHCQTSLKQRSCPPDSRCRAFRNYVKFLVNGDGQAVKRYNPSYDPADAETDVRLALAGKAPTPAECFLHPGRKVCNADLLLS